MCLIVIISDEKRRGGGGGKKKGSKKKIGNESNNEGPLPFTEYFTSLPDLPSERASHFEVTKNKDG